MNSKRLTNFIILNAFIVFTRTCAIYLFPVAKSREIETLDMSSFGILKPSILYHENNLSLFRDVAVMGYDDDGLAFFMEFEYMTQHLCL